MQARTLPPLSRLSVDAHETQARKYDPQWSTVIATPHSNGSDSDDNTKKQPLNNYKIRDAVAEWIYGTFEEKNTVETMYGPISQWNTTKVTDMSALFKNQSTFNEDISL